MLTTDTPISSHIVSDHCYAVVDDNAASSKPFELFNPWGTDASGRVPGYSQYYGLFSRAQRLSCTTSLGRASDCIKGDDPPLDDPSVRTVALSPTVAENALSFVIAEV